MTEMEVIDLLLQKAKISKNKGGRGTEIGFAPQNYSQYCLNGCGKRVVEKAVNATYEIIFEQGKIQANKELAEKIFSVLKDNLGYSKATEIAKLLNCTDSMISQLKRGTPFSKDMLNSVLSRHSSQIFRSIFEFEECSPICISKKRNRKSRYPKNSWKLFSKEQSAEEKRIQDLLKNKDGSQKIGVYAMYDSAGRILYFGQTQAQTGLYGEITQQLDNKINRSLFLPENGNLKKRGAWDLRMGDLTRYVSAIEVLVPEAIDNIETFVLRLIPNDDANTNLGNYEIIKSQE
ncbi:hypothetical protein IKQ19_11285 [Candidatus Saccharibacteria bacterium]|nr:hypothetical protein [Candidatus Saccharibacteria bacterium]